MWRFWRATSWGFLGHNTLDPGKDTVIKWRILESESWTRNSLVREGNQRPSDVLDPEGRRRLDTQSTLFMKMNWPWPLKKERKKKR